jgi:hypothetical protein
MRSLPQHERTPAAQQRLPREHRCAPCPQRSKPRRGSAATSLGARLALLPSMSRNHRDSRPLRLGTSVVERRHWAADSRPVALELAPLLVCMALCGSACGAVDPTYCQRGAQSGTQCYSKPEITGDLSRQGRPLPEAELSGPPNPVKGLPPSASTTRTKAAPAARRQGPSIATAWTLPARQPAPDGGAED